MKIQKELYQIVCNKCSTGVIIYVDKGHDPILREELGGYQLYPTKSDRFHEYHLCPACQRLEPKFKVVEGGKDG